MVKQKSSIIYLKDFVTEIKGYNLLHNPQFYEIHEKLLLLTFS